jgi:hypothetical protein
MFRMSWAFVLSIVLIAPAMGDVSDARTADRDAEIAREGAGGAAAFCSIIYYNFCSGWIWIWSGWDGANWTAGDEIGVVFDLAAECDKLPGEHCTNTIFYWYWRFTQPTYWPITYYLYEADATGCKLGPPVGSRTDLDPLERWNIFPGLGVVTSDYALLSVSWDYGFLPRPATEVNLLMDPGFECGGTATESSTWGEVKGLFK